MEESKLLGCISTNIRMYRKQANLSQEQLAERSGLHRTYVSAVERGARNLTVLALERIARGLNVSTVHLLLNYPDESDNSGR